MIRDDGVRPGRGAARLRGLALAVVGLAGLAVPRAHAQPEPVAGPSDPVAPTAEPTPTEPEPPPAPDVPPEPEPTVPAATEDAPAPPSAGSGLPKIDIHGFVSQGAFVSTTNDYIGTSSRGSIAFFEAGLNFSTALTDRLRAGVQVFARRVGEFDDPLHVDWAFLDYSARPWLGLRAGVIKMPFGLYNEHVDIDGARNSILLPQSVYPLRNRNVLISHTGAAIHGTVATAAGELEYQAWLGTLSIPRNALELSGATLESIDTKYVAGGQVFWHPPLEGLKLGATYLRASIDFHLRLDPATVAALIAAGLVPADYDGALLVAQRPTEFPLASVEYVRGGLLVAAEYGRTLTHQPTSLPTLVPTVDSEEERFYAMATYRLWDRVELGGYYAVTHKDVHDRAGRDPRWAERFHAFQRDLAATVRYDVNDYWLWKLEAHFIDGTSELTLESRLASERTWGLALVKTTVIF